jgi:glycine/D-amino acid oxidase-like deaminating enzyme
VVIVGGGLAGLCCARRLVRSGVEVRLFEAAEDSTSSNFVSVGSTPARWCTATGGSGDWPTHGDIRSRVSGLRCRRC